MAVNNVQVLDMVEVVEAFLERKTYAVSKEQLQRFIPECLSLGTFEGLLVG
jgi:hypothetical protein